jgi:hypothetical protein
MGRRVLISGRDADQHRLAEASTEEIDRNRQRHRLRSDKIACPLAAVGRWDGRTIVDFAGESGGYYDNRQAAIRAESRSQRIPDVDDPLDNAVILHTVDRLTHRLLHRLERRRLYGGGELRGRDGLGRIDKCIQAMIAITLFTSICKMVRTACQPVMSRLVTGSVRTTAALSLFRASLMGGSSRSSSRVLGGSVTPSIGTPPTDPHA